MQLSPRRPALLALFALCAGGCTAAVSSPERDATPPTAPQRATVVAIGDLHGDLVQARRALRLAEVIDADDRWAGGDTILVQTGDVFDRGPDSRAIYQLLRSLIPQAREAGGQVHLLLGNHEVMNLVGDLRYVHPGDTAAFGGAAARRAALALDAELGGWLAAQPVVLKVGDTVFAHGGVREEWAKLGIDRINARAHDALRTDPDERRRAEILGPDGPLWFRGYIAEPEAIACPELSAALERLGASRMVVGHTTQRSGQIVSRCGGRVHGIDIGIAAAYGGNLGVWRLSDKGALAVYPDRIETLPGVHGSTERALP